MKALSTARIPSVLFAEARVLAELCLGKSGLVSLGGLDGRYLLYGGNEDQGISVDLGEHHYKHALTVPLTAINAALGPRVSDPTVVIEQTTVPAQLGKCAVRMGGHLIPAQAATPPAPALLESNRLSIGEVEAESLRSALDSVLHASPKTPRQSAASLDGICLNPKSGTLTATNGYRLHTRRLQVRGDLTHPILLSLSAAHFLVRALPFGSDFPVSLWTMADQLLATWGRVTFDGRLMELPPRLTDYDQLLERSRSGYLATVRTLDLLRILNDLRKKATVMTLTSHQPVLDVVVHDDNGAVSAELTIPATNLTLPTGHGARVNAQYLFDAMCQIRGQEIELRWRGCIDALHVGQPNSARFEALLMPLRPFIPRFIGKPPSVAGSNFDKTPDEPPRISD